MNTLSLNISTFPGLLFTQNGANISGQRGIRWGLVNPRELLLTIVSYSRCSGQNTWEQQWEGEEEPTLWPQV